MKTWASVVGTSNVVALSIGAPSKASAVPLGSFFVGASLSSFALAPTAFRKLGRKGGFLVGVALGLVASAVGVAALVAASTAAFSVSCLLFGASTGIGFHLRFAVVELVPESWSATAVALVVSGGCFAAFAGPQSAEASKGAFGGEGGGGGGEDDNLTYMGVLVAAAAFSALNAAFVSFVSFPAQSVKPAESTEESSSADVEQQPPPLPPSETEMRSETRSSILLKRSFLVPVVLAALSWSIMALPMSLLRVAMQQEGYSSGEGLLAIQLHFLGMYLPVSIRHCFVR